MSKYISCSLFVLLFFLIDEPIRNKIVFITFNPIQTSLLKTLSALFSPTLFSLTFSFSLLFTRLQNRLIRELAFASLILYPLISILKVSIGRLRPATLMSPFALLPFSFETFSFSTPSSHAAAVGLFSTLFPSKWAPLFFLLTLPRLLLLEHYLSDLLLGFILGRIIKHLTNAFLNYLESKNPLKWFLR